MKRGEPSRRHILPTLTLLFAAGIAAAPSTAQNVLETRTGAVRVWDPSGQTAVVPLAQGWVARTGVAAEGGHVVAGEDLARADLFFVVKDGAGTTELPVPPRADAVERARPVLLTRHGRLDGAVWLEGDAASGLAVVAAAWNGTSWEAVETIAPANGRPQLAPAATALADGTWLVVWAGYDGGDDDIFWSRRRDGVWSSPRRLHGDNRVPDILPALTTDAADTDQALAAWSFYDGNDYRVRAARFAGGRWTVEPSFDGLGADRMLWQESGGRSFVTYRSVVPAGWTAIELAPDGRVLHQVTVETTDDRPPIVEARSGFDAPRLTWPYAAPRPRR